MKPKKYGSQFNLWIPDELKAELLRLSEERQESIADIARRGIEAEVARLKA
jgi:transposase-like protein